MHNLLLVLLTALSTLFKTSTTLRVENVALRRQLGVLHRSSPKRLQLTASDRLFWVWLTRVWSDWRSALMIVKPETVVAWHCKGFRVFWRWKIRHGKPGRPTVSREVRDLIRTMSRASPLWGAPRIHGELLKLGIEISEPTVSKWFDPASCPRDLADLPRKSRPELGFGGFLRRTNNPLPGLVRVPSASA